MVTYCEIDYARFVVKTDAEIHNVFFIISSFSGCD